MEWFQERYISRDEHRKIVEYYRKLVAQLHVSLRDLRGAQADSQTAPQLPTTQPTPAPAAKDVAPEIELFAENIIRLDFRRQRRRGA